jgi:hypothetical protein
MIKPTNGRIVWFHPQGHFQQQDPEQPLAAIITHVWSDNVVNLCVFSSNGIPYNMTSVALKQSDTDDFAGRMYCEWMPYQKGQAAKTEELQNQLR